MCRFLLIIDNNYSNYLISKFLNQSINKKFTPFLDNVKDIDYHKDGYGLAYLENNKWKIYKNTNTFNNDENFPKILKDIKKNILVAHIRASCPNNKIVCLENTHPFNYKNFIWCHNGCAKEINKFRNKYIKKINKKFYPHIKGNTDSEIMFYYFLTLLHNFNFIIAIRNFFYDLKNNNYKISANIIFTNKNISFVSRFVNRNLIAPSLYINKSDKIIISSEPLLDEYKLVDNNVVFIFDNITKKLLHKIKII